MWGSNLKRKQGSSGSGILHLAPRDMEENWHEWHARTGDDYPVSFKRNCTHSDSYERLGKLHCIVCGTQIKV